MKVAEMRILKWVWHTRKDMIRNEAIHRKVGVASREDKMREAKLSWFRHVKTRCTDTPVRRPERLAIVSVRRGRVRSKKS
ncbi:hypothetical protein H5410_062756 [Solanum commersonii]|uniref:Uncharacterized protein n=1 Tax=Solanum commersonii TaxID=4109 RepID=A0A9J5WDN2_SOLCO|nr:hypothetical protein H5410_062756 [Solanum commersonii]